MDKRALGQLGYAFASLADGISGGRSQMAKTLMQTNAAQIQQAILDEQVKKEKERQKVAKYKRVGGIVAGPIGSAVGGQLGGEKFSDTAIGFGEDVLENAAKGLAPGGTQAANALSSGGQVAGMNTSLETAQGAVTQTPGAPGTPQGYVKGGTPPQVPGATAGVPPQAIVQGDGTVVIPGRGQGDQIDQLFDKAAASKGLPVAAGGAPIQSQPLAPPPPVSIAAPVQAPLAGDPPGTPRPPQPQVSDELVRSFSTEGATSQQAQGAGFRPVSKTVTQTSQPGFFDEGGAGPRYAKELLDSGIFSSSTDGDYVPMEVGSVYGLTPEETMQVNTFMRERDEFRNQREQQRASVGLERDRLSATREEASLDRGLNREEGAADRMSQQSIADTNLQAQQEFRIADREFSRDQFEAEGRRYEERDRRGYEHDQTMRSIPQAQSPEDVAYSQAQTERIQGEGKQQQLQAYTDAKTTARQILALELDAQKLSDPYGTKPGINVRARLQELEKQEMLSRKGMFEPDVWDQLTMGRYDEQPGAEGGFLFDPATGTMKSIGGASGGTASTDASTLSALESLRPEDYATLAEAMGRLRDSMGKNTTPKKKPTRPYYETPINEREGVRSIFRNRITP